MMQIFKYKKTKPDHILKLVKLLQSQGLAPDEILDIPKVGYLVVNDTVTVAFGAIRMVEGNKGLFDSYITNRNASPEDRHKALDLLTFHLIKMAKAMGIIHVISLSDNNTILSRAEKHGFKTTSHKIQLLKT
jgi:hypothetical protein